MKLEDLKLPSHDELFVIWDSAPSVDIGIAGISYQVAKSVCDQMREHYEADKQPAPEWRLPDPPPGRKWHRDDWTPDMLPEGYRPLMLWEDVQPGDEYNASSIQDGSPWRPCVVASPYAADEDHSRRRTRRPLPATPAQPAPVEYVPLEPGDVPLRSMLRKRRECTYSMIHSVGIDGVSAGNSWYSYRYLAEHYEILRPNSTTWEPCKKPKA